MAIALWTMPEGRREISAEIIPFLCCLDDSGETVRRLEPKDEEYDLTPKNETLGMRELLRVYADGTAKYRAITADNSEEVICEYEIPKDKEHVTIERPGIQPGSRRITNVVMHIPDGYIDRVMRKL